jgi:acetylornithine deacetylase/succinyl-diaminopimelate desuccinylase-like protein
MLCRIINDLKDRDGRITIPGFYDDVVELTEAERTAYAELPFREPEFFEDLGVSQGNGEKGFTTLERIWARPTLELNGMGGGFQEKGSKTIVPTHAFAKISMRLVPNQNPAKILDALEQHLLSIPRHGFELEYDKGHYGSPFLAPLDHPHMRSAENAMTAAFGAKTFFIRDGASIPIVNSLAQKLGATCILAGVDVPEGKIHSPNEMLVLDNFYKGIEMIAHLLPEIRK